MRSLPKRDLAKSRPSTAFVCAFAPVELQAIRIGELDLAAHGARYRPIFRIRRRNPATKLADERLEALRALVVAAGSDPTGLTLLGPYRMAIKAGVELVKLQALLDRYWRQTTDAKATACKEAR